MTPSLIPSLLQIQHRCGFLPEHELEFLAVRAGIPLYRLEELTTFFPHFRRHEPPRVSVDICESVSCQLRGAAGLLEGARKRAERAGDHVLEVRGVSCLGRCDRAPVALLGRHAGDDPDSGDRLYTRLGDGRDIETLISAALEGDAVPPPHPHEPAGPAPAPAWEIDLYRPPAGAGSGSGLIGEGEAPAEPVSTQYSVLSTQYSGARREPRPPELGHYHGSARYAAVRQFLADQADKQRPPAEKLTAAAVLQRLAGAYLFGMGGAAASTARKWDDVTKEVKKRKCAAYVVCNGDESEPGTFKDRELLRHTPHLVIEGMLLAGLIMHGEGGGPVRGYLYIRHEYPEQIRACRDEIENARRIVPEALERCPLEVFVSPGAYICGEESALLEAIEGKRAQPRNQPPSIRSNGLDDKPTLVNNVETFAWVPAIVLQHSGWWRQAPRRFFSISGDVAEPGVFEVPFTQTTLGQLIDLAGGLRDGMKLLAVSPSGPSAGFLPATLRLPKPVGAILTDEAIQGLAKRSPHAEAAVRAFRDRAPDRVELDVRELLLDKQFFRLLELDLGAGIVVFGGTDARSDGARQVLLEPALNYLRFFEKESCGKCVPCRLGCQQLVHLAADLKGPVSAAQRQQAAATARTLATAMEVTSICGLGRSAANPLLTLLEHF